MLLTYECMNMEDINYNRGVVYEANCLIVSFYIRFPHGTLNTGDTMPIYGKTRVCINGGWLNFSVIIDSCGNVPRSWTVNSKSDDASDWCSLWMVFLGQEGF